MSPVLGQVFTAPSIDWWALSPQIILLGAALLILVVSSLLAERCPVWFSGVVALVAGAGVFVSGFYLWYDIRDGGPRAIVSGALSVDGFSVLFILLVAVAVVMTVLVADAYLEREHMDPPEFHALLLLAATGAIVMASAADLIVLFLGLESLSIGLYVMAAMQFRREEAQEAAMKYFILGAFSSAFFLYGIAMVYGATGSTGLAHARDYLNRLDTAIVDQPWMLMLGFALLLVGLAFKVAAVPFHFWAPDVYQGSPAPVSGFMASAAKAAGFAAMLRIFFVAFGQSKADWSPVLGVLAVITLVVGVVMAIIQTDLKRMIAFSSIAHAGYILVGVQAGTSEGTAAALFYLFSYTLMVLGTFAVISLVQWRDGQPLDRFEGLADRRPLIGFALTVFLLGQAGVPLTSGFIAKFLVIKAAVDERTWWLAIAAMLVSAAGAYIYLRVIFAVWRRPDDGDSTIGTEAGSVVAPVVPLASGLAILGAMAFTLVVGFVPQFLIEFARDAVPVLIG